MVFASFIISSSLFKSCIIPVAWVCHPLRSMSITDTSSNGSLAFSSVIRTSLQRSPPQRFRLQQLAEGLMSGLHTERPSLISSAVTATSYMEGSQPFIYRCAPRGTRTGTLVHGLLFRVDEPVPMTRRQMIVYWFFFAYYLLYYPHKKWISTFILQPSPNLHLQPV